MDQKAQFPKEFSIKQAMELANSPMGRQLLAALQQRGGADFQKAAAEAGAGNYDQAKQSLSSLLADPQIKELLKQFGG